MPDRIEPLHTVLVGQAHVSLYTGLLALLINLAVALLVSLAVATPAASRRPAAT